MYTNPDIQQLITLSEKPMTGFSVTFNHNMLIVKVKSKTVLFGCLVVLVVALTVALFFYFDTNPYKYIFASAPIILGLVGLINLSKNATQTTFNFSDKSVIYENRNFIGKLFNKPLKLLFSDITGIKCREETISNTSSSNNTTSRNFVFKIYMETQHAELQLLTVNKGVLKFEEVEELTAILKKAIR